MVGPAGQVPETLRALGSEARHAWSQYGMLVIPGVEPTNDSGGCYILGVDVKECIDRALPVQDIVGPKKPNDVVDHKFRHLVSWETLLRYKKYVASAKSAIRKNHLVHSACADRAPNANEGGHPSDAHLRQIPAYASCQR